MLQLNQCIRRFVEDYSLELGLSLDTQKNKRNSMRRFVGFLREKPLDPDNCREYFAYLRRRGWQPSSVANEIRVVRAFINFLYKRGYIEQSFAKDLILPKVFRKILDIVPAETAERIIIAGTEPSPFDNRIAKSAKIETRLALRFALRTGLRISELVGLRSQDVNLEAETFLVKSKGGDFNVMPLPPEMVRELRPRLKNEKLFQVGKETLNIALNRGGKILNLTRRITCHSLRHTFCTTLLKNGIPLQIVSRLMRHSSIKITDETYSHYNTEDLKQALITGHPLLRGALSDNDWLRLVEAAVKRTGVMDVGRFTFATTPGGLSLTAGVV